MHECLLLLQCLFLRYSTRIVSILSLIGLSALLDSIDLSLTLSAPLSPSQSLVILISSPLKILKFSSSSFLVNSSFYLLLENFRILILIILITSMERWYLILNIAFKNKKINNVFS